MDKDPDKGSFSKLVEAMVSRLGSGKWIPAHFFAPFAFSLLSTTLSQNETEIKQNNY